ncbi:MAG: hypothetical protein V7K57_03570 [Nostoc sp.]
MIGTFQFFDQSYIFSGGTGVLAVSDIFDLESDRLAKFLPRHDCS